MSKSVNNTGRNTKASKHVRLYEHVLKSDAYQSLDVYARALLVQFGRRYNGSNNGKIHMSYRDAATLCNCSQKPIRRAFEMLQERGFIKISKKGGFSVKVRHATEWTLTEFAVGNELATKEFMRWKKSESKPNTKKSRRTYGTSSAYPKQKTSSKNEQICSNGVPLECRERKNGTSHGVPRGCTYSIPYTPEKSAGKQPTKRQAKPSDVQGSAIQFRSDKSQSEVLFAVGGLCKISHLTKDAYKKITDIQKTKQLSSAKIRSLVIQEQVRAASSTV